MVRRLLILSLVAFFTTALDASPRDVIRLHSGEEFRGRILRETAAEVTIKLDFTSGVLVFSRKKILDIRHSRAGSNPGIIDKSFGNPGNSSSSGVVLKRLNPKQSGKNTFSNGEFSYTPPPGFERFTPPGQIPNLIVAFRRLESNEVTLLHTVPLLGAVDAGLLAKVMNAKSGWPVRPMGKRSITVAGREATLLKLAVDNPDMKLHQTFVLIHGSSKGYVMVHTCPADLASSSGRTFEGSLESIRFSGTVSSRTPTTSSGGVTQMSLNEFLGKAQKRGQKTPHQQLFKDLPELFMRERATKGDTILDRVDGRIHGVGFGQSNPVSR